jgi:4-amino-4-deoxy-L-arabinose transferase-like glycosyltransferase
MVRRQELFRRNDGMIQVLFRRAGHHACLVMVAVGLYFTNLGSPSLWDIDEGNNAEAAREMFESGNWIVPTFNFQLRSDKPALLYWMQMAAYRWFGINEFAARFPSAFASVITVLLTYEFGRRMFNPTTAFLGGLILASTIMFCAAAHFANPDALLVLFSALNLFVFFNSYSRGDRWWFVLSSTSAALAVLAKGPIGLVLPVAVTGLFLVWSRGLRLLWDWRLLVGVCVFSLVAVPWYVWVGSETKTVFLREFLETHNTGRYLGTMEGHGGPVFYYLVCLLAGFAPWSVFIGPVVWYGSVRGVEGGGWRAEGGTTAHAPRPTPHVFLWCWILTYGVFFSFSATKLPNYILPIYPPLALLTARFLDRWRCRAIAAPAWLLPSCLVGLTLIGVAIGAGLILAAGVIRVPFLHGHSVPGLEKWSIVGLVPIAGAVAAWCCLRRDRRVGLIGILTVTAIALVAPVAIWGTSALDAHKAARPLVELSHARQTDHEIRIACYQFFEPSLVFYCRREVTRLDQEREALEFLRYPIPVYLFVPAPLWEGLASKATGNCQVVARHEDLYRGCPVVVVTNGGGERGVGTGDPVFVPRPASWFPPPALAQPLQ